MNFDRISGWAPQWLSVVRITTALLFLEHGTQKLFNFPPAPEPMQLSGLLLVQGLIEVVGGMLLAIGLFTRPVAFILSGNMAVAYFMAHAPQNFYPVINEGDTAILYCFIFLYFFFAGGGPWSVDAARRGSGLATP
ncbi:MULTISPECIES: DoxX family protein [unclassified Sinorhizobium]|uniref:DoxX family protein n=1 Tax=unclassified Sinorhizobium TaxID=2613772 RepID=UPI0024C439E4|nr:MULTISPECIES: DoxX family protein [unclassified Sinorhizobium]MDK1373521.1 DoxX family protein [Sinorhizobium sp. 6-70]MDK1479757.1 DoxX family protein [Sinorhizobium sp. 6-117]